MADQEWVWCSRVILLLSYLTYFFLVVVEMYENKIIAMRDILVSELYVPIFRGRSQREKKENNDIFFPSLA